METKAFEIRDEGTFIPVIATRMTPWPQPRLGEMTPWELRTKQERERYLLRRSGFSFDDPLVMLCRMEANGSCPHEASYDVYGWGGARTMAIAHDFIQRNWDKLKSGEVIDVQFILKETPAPKLSEETF